jgi:hypothetical protein
MAAAEPTVYKLLSAAITATAGTSAPIRAEGRQLISFYFVSTGTTSSGTFLIEEAYYPPDEPVYAGTWSLIQTVLASAFTGGAQIAYHLNPTALASFRVRQTVNVGGGGSVDCYAIVYDKPF